LQKLIRMKKYLFAILILSSTKIFAQTKIDSVTVMDEVIINENRLNTPISKQNRNVYVIDRATIEKLPGRSLQEILQYANGVDIRQRGPFGSQADISIDGGSFEQTVLLLNGIKIIDSQTSHNMLNIPIPVEMIGRIEVIRGPAARIYGINSLTGAINIVTKKPTKTGFLLNSYAGSNFEKNTEGSGKTFYNAGTQIGGALSKEKQQHSLFASLDKSNGYRFNTGFENSKIFYQGNIQIDSLNEIMASAGYVNNGFGANGFYAAPGDKNSYEEVQTTLASIQSKHRLSPKWTLMPSLSYRYNYDDYRYFSESILDKGRSQHYTNSFSAEVNTAYKMATGELGFGAEGRVEAINSSNIGKHRRDNLGMYAQYRTYFFEKLNVNIGAYLNYNSDYNWQIYPGIDLSYALTNELVLVGNIGTSQRLPSFTDLYLDQRPGNIGNPNVTPENALQSEFGIKFNKNAFTVNVNYFHRNIADFIDYTRATTAEPFQSGNFGDLNTNGLNMRSGYFTKLSEQSKINFVLAYSYLASEFKDVKQNVSSKYQISSLKHQVTNTVDFSYKHFSILYATRFNERATGASYWIHDLRLSQKINRVTLYMDAQNIFNATYNEVGAVPLPSKWVNLGVKLSYL